MDGWRRYVFYKTAVVRTTWKLRLGALAGVLILAAITRPIWALWIAQSLVCTGSVTPAEVLLLENFDPHYVVFERAAELQNAGLAPRALVPVETGSEPGVANPVSQGVAEVMARQARLGLWEVLPVRHVEPITLNAALQIRDRLSKDHRRSVIVVAPAFRSRRASLIYGTVLDDIGARVSCVPVFGAVAPEEWFHTWHGVQNVVGEFLKLQYYRFYVIPFIYRRQ